MTPDHFQRLVATLQRGMLPGRNLFLWSGPEPPLRDLLGPVRTHDISTIGLLDDLVPRATEGLVRQHLARRLAHALEGVTFVPAIVVVHHCGLLARYLSDLTILFEWLNSRRLLILLCPPVPIDRLLPVPDGLIIAPAMTSNRLGTVVPTGQVVEWIS